MCGTPVQVEVHGNGAETWAGTRTAAGTASAGKVKRRKTGVIVGCCAAALVFAAAGICAAALLRSGEGANGATVRAEDSHDAGSGGSGAQEQPDRTPAKEQNEPAKETAREIFLPDSITIIKPDKTVTQTYQYQANGFSLEAYQYMDGLLNMTEEWEFDTDGRLLRRVQTLPEDMDQEDVYEYDSEGRQTCYTHTVYDIKEEERRQMYQSVMNFTYGSDGKITGISDGDGTEYALEFNPDGTLNAYNISDEIRYAFNYQDGAVSSMEMTRTDENGTVVWRQNSVYDGSGSGVPNCGKVLSLTSYDGTEVSAEYHYTYISASFDEHGIILPTENEGSEKMLSKVTHYWMDELSTEEFYDENGRIIQEIGYDDDYGSRYKYTNYEYDEQGRLTSEKVYNYDTDDLVWWCEDFQYDSQGNVIHKNEYSAISNSLMYTYFFQYDENGLLISQAQMAPAGKDMVSFYSEKTYDEYGNITGNHYYDMTVSGVEPSYVKEHGEYDYYEYENEYDSEHRLTASYEWLRIFKGEEKNNDTYSCKKIYEYDSGGSLLKESWYNSWDECYSTYECSYTYR